MSFDYDTVRIAVDEDEGRQLVIVATGPIGIEYVGLWDDMIVEGATLSDDHPFARRCWSEIEQRGEAAFDTGSPARNGRRFQTLDVEFQDGSGLRVVAARFEVEGDDG